jgi:D-amino-acid dehydrogenase
MVYSRLNGATRIAGFADFTGFDTSADDERIELLSQMARRFAPQAADYDAPEARAWGGFRPMTPDGRPLVGATRIPGLYVNVGHGMLGWTLACATAHDAAHAVAGLR